MCSASARALQLVAHGRDTYVYYRVEELELDWDFNDTVRTRDMSRRLDRIASVLHSRPCALFSGARLACASKALAESLEPHKELEQAVLWLRKLSGSVCEDDVRDCADLLEAAGEVDDYQSRFGMSMRVTCADGSALKDLASRLRELADAMVRCPPGGSASLMRSHHSSKILSARHPGPKTSPRRNGILP